MAHPQYNSALSPITAHRVVYSQFDTTNPLRMFWCVSRGRMTMISRGWSQLWRWKIPLLTRLHLYLRQRHKEHKHSEGEQISASRTNPATCSFLAASRPVQA